MLVNLLAWLCTAPGVHKGTLQRFPELAFDIFPSELQASSCAPDYIFYNIFYNIFYVCFHVLHALQEPEPMDMYFCHWNCPN